MPLHTTVWSGGIKSPADSAPQTKQPATYFWSSRSFCCFSNFCWSPLALALRCVASVSDLESETHKGIINRSISEVKNLVRRDLSKHTQTHTHTHTHWGTSIHKHSDYTKLNIHSLKRAANARETWNEQRSTEQKTWQVYNFGKRNVFRFDLNESREGFSRVTETPSLSPDSQPTSSCTLEFSRLWQMTGIFSNKKI